MNKKLIPLFVSALISLSSFGNDKKIPNREIWIAVSPNVLSKIAKSKIRVFNPKETIKGKDENFYKIDESDLNGLSHFIHHAFKRCGGFRVLAGAPQPNMVSNKNFKDVEFGEFWPNELDQFIDANYTIERTDEVNDWFKNISEPHMNEVVNHLSSYYTRYYNSPEGIAALKWIGSQWEELAKSRNDIDVQYFKHANFDQPSIILTVHGSDEIKKDQIIILGGHADSINADNQEAHLRSPGANDNAASIALLSDIIKILIEKNYRPKHTIQFIAYAAEEVGLQGSGEIARLYRQTQKKVLGVMQFDGINYTGTTYQMALIADGTNPAQDQFLAKLVDEYVKVSWAWDKCDYACSDHYSWHHEGYRASFPAEAIMSEQDPYIHTDQDTFDKSNFSTSHATQIEKLGISYLLEMDK